MKVLVVISEPITAQQLRSALPEGAGQNAELMIVAPALHEGALRFWVSDADGAIARAEEVRRRTVRDLGADGIPASSDTGEGDPEDAIEDAVRTFPADRILIFAHPEGEQRYREDVDLEALRSRFGIPVSRVTVDADLSAR